MPTRIDCSSTRKKSDCVSLMMRSFCAFSMFFTHRLACPCGSTISGQRRERVTKMAFSIESVSIGRP